MGLLHSVSVFVRGNTNKPLPNHTHTLRYQFIWMLLFLLSESLMFNICLHFVREPLNQLKGHIEAIASGGVEHES